MGKITLKVGQFYISRDKRLFEVIKELGEGDYGYDKGLLFQAVCRGDRNSDNYSDTFILYYPDGFHDCGYVTSTCDLVRRVNITPGEIMEEEVSPGDIIATMVDHVPTLGLITGWECHDTKFEITPEQYGSMIGKPGMTVLADDKAFLVSKTVSVDGDVSSVLVAYEESYNFFVAMFWSPKWDKALSEIAST